VTHAFSHTNAPTSKFNKMDHNARIAAAIADLESQDRTNIAAVARKWGGSIARRYRSVFMANYLDQKTITLSKSASTSSLRALVSRGTSSRYNSKAISSSCLASSSRPNLLSDLDRLKNALVLSGLYMLRSPYASRALPKYSLADDQLWNWAHVRQDTYTALLSSLTRA
jgi:hypothetical protein